MSLTDTLKDAAYVTIGFGVLGFQRAQVRRQELRKQLDAQLADQFAGLVAPIRTQVEIGLDTVEANLPPTVQDLVHQARATVRSRLGIDPAAA